MDLSHQMLHQKLSDLDLQCLKNGEKSGISWEKVN